MVRQPDATTRPAPQDNQLMSKHGVLGFKPQLRLEWRGQDGQNETEQPDNSASLGDSITSSTRIRFSGTHRATFEAKKHCSVGSKSMRVGGLDQQALIDIRGTQRVASLSRSLDQTPSGYPRSVAT